MVQNKKNLEKIGFRYAWNGLLVALANEYNFRIHAISAALVVVLGFVFKVTITEWLFLISAIATVLVAELFNTAVEGLCNLVSNDKNPQIGFVKDVAAGAVLVAAGYAAIVGLIIFAPKLFYFFSDCRSNFW